MRQLLMVLFKIKLYDQTNVYKIKLQLQHLSCMIFNRNNSYTYKNYQINVGEIIQPISGYMYSMYFFLKKINKLFQILPCLRSLPMT